MKSIILDLDGTIVRAGVISNLCIDVIRECKNKEIAVGIATSRPYYTSACYVDVLNADFLVASSGAWVSVNSNVILRSRLDKEECNYIIDLFNFHNIDSMVIIEGSKQYYCNSQECKAWSGFENTIYYDTQKPFSSEAYKIILPHNEKTELILSLEELFAFEVSVYNNLKWIKILKKGSTKYSGLNLALSHMGLSFQDVISFGDDDDDKEMLINSAIGVAVENATCSLKKNADAVCDSIDFDGVPKWILANVL